ncbi:MAG: CaiB/BaiF CoA transferase family protein [Candidatus Dormibacteria bacterium]
METADRSANAPLSGIRVLELGQIIAGTYGGMILADLGAEVIKVEPPRGDLGRNPDQATVGGISAIHLTMNRGKKSIAIDLKKPAGIAAFHDLVRNSDVVIDNFRPGVVERMQADYATLSAINPRIICCSVTGFGRSGPDRDVRSFDLIHQGMTGHMSITGSPGGPPAREGVPLADLGGAVFSVPAVLAAVIERERTGHGQLVELSMFQTMAFLLSYDATMYLNTGAVPHAWGSAHAYAVPWQAFETADGWLVVATREESLWRRFCATIDLPALVDDPRFASNRERVANREVLVPILEEKLRECGTEEWLDRFRAGQVPAGPVNSVAGALDHPTLATNNGIVDVPMDPLGSVRMVANPIRFADHPDPAYVGAPHLGEHTQKILREVAGYTEERVAELLTDAVVFDNSVTVAARASLS